jgi:hypothetical protein
VGKLVARIAGVTTLGALDAAADYVASQPPAVRDNPAVVAALAQARDGLTVPA